MKYPTSKNCPLQRNVHFKHNFKHVLVINHCHIDFVVVDLVGVDLMGVDLMGVDLMGVDLVGVDLVGVDLVGVDLMGVDLVGGHCLIGLLSTMRPHFEPLHCRTMLGNVTVAR